MKQHTTTALGALRRGLQGVRTRLRSDRGEGVISAAITVLIMAFLGALMWAAFNTLWTNTSENVTNQVNQIGQSSTTGGGSGGGTT